MSPVPHCAQRRPERTVKENFLPWATTGSGRWGIHWDYSHWPPFQVHLCVPPSTPDYKASAMANPRHNTCSQGPSPVPENLSHRDPELKHSHNPEKQRGMEALDFVVKVCRLCADCSPTPKAGGATSFSSPRVACARVPFAAGHRVCARQYPFDQAMHQA